MFQKLILVSLFPALLWADASSFEFTNDVFAPNGRDRYLTNRVGYNYTIDQHWKAGLWSDMYSPNDLRSSEPPIGDHPYSGYTFAHISYKTNDLISNKVIENRRFSLNLGALGPASQADDLQKFIHKDLDLGVPPEGWDTQADSQMAVDFIYAHNAISPLTSYLGDTTAVQTYGFRVGNVIDSVFLDQEIRKQFFGRITGLIGGTIEIIAFNTHIEGRAFSSNINTYTAEAEPLVSTARAGIEVDTGRFTLGFIASYQTPTFEGQDDNHLYGTVIVRYNK